jgi:hypothetical protein
MREVEFSLAVGSTDVQQVPYRLLIIDEFDWLLGFAAMPLRGIATLCQRDGLRERFGVIAASWEGMTAVNEQFRTTWRLTPPQVSPPSNMVTALHHAEESKRGHVHTNQSSHMTFWSALPLRGKRFGR